MTIALETQSISSEEKLFRIVLQAVFQISNKQLDCFFQIRNLSQSRTCILNLVQKLRSERSLVQKQIKTLLDRGLIIRDAVSLSEFKAHCIESGQTDLEPKSNKGYLYLYSALPDSVLLQKIKTSLNGWANFIETYLNSSSEF